VKPKKRQRRLDVQKEKKANEYVFHLRREWNEHTGFMGGDGKSITGEKGIPN